MREPTWAEVIPAFRGCYDYIVGHFYLERRGLRQWKDWLSQAFPAENGKSYYQTYFCAAAALCDAVVLTTPALIETDFGLPACEGSETLAGELIRRFGCALLDSSVVEHIIGKAATESLRRPRVYVLTSITCEYEDERRLHLYDALHIDRMLFRQRQLIAGGFDDANRPTLPSLIVTGSANIESGEIEAHLLEGQMLFHLPISTRGTMSCDAHGRLANSWLQMIALWPIQVGL